MLNSRIIEINSNERLTGTHGNFTYALKKSIMNEEDYTHVSVLKASIPVSYYLIQEKYNFIHLIEGGVTTKVTMEAANYNSNSFMKTLTTKLNAAGSFTYNMTMRDPFTQADTGKIYFTVSNNNGVQPSIVINHMHEQLGFNKNDTVSFINNKLVSDNVVSFIPERTLFIHSSLVDNIENSSTTVLESVFCDNVKNYSVVRFNNPDVIGYSKKIIPLKSIFTIRITDENETPIDFNGSNIVLSLLFYRSINNLIKDYINYKLNID
jgi:hypothetical protein